METIIKIDGRDVKFKATAAIPRIYRIKFRRDIMKDLNKLSETAKSENEFSIPDLEVFENVAFIMAKHADNSIADTVENWLDDFEMFSVYEILPQILELWNMNMETQIESKKNKMKAIGN